MYKLNHDKLEIQKQWDKDPCGASTAQNKTPGTLEFYRAIRDHRYNIYAPWFDEKIRFSDWKDKDILEIGVGLGSDHFSFAINRNRMTALDLSREHLKQTVQHLELERLSTSPIYGDAENMPFKDNSFDLVYSFGVLHHTPNTEAAVAEIHRVLRPSGIAIIALYHRNSWFFWLQTILANGIINRGLWRKGWRRLLSEIEFRSDQSSAMPVVKVYSRRQARKLFSAFSKIDITTSHVEVSHFTYFNRLIRTWSRQKLEKRFGFWGWYLVIRAYKC